MDIKIVAFVGLLLIPLTSFFLLLAGPSERPFRTQWLVLTAISLGLLLSLVVAAHASWEHAWPWFGVAEDRVFLLSFRVDALSKLMLVLVSFVSGLVQVFSVAYMKGDPHYNRYFAYLSLFTLAMLGLVTAGNLLVLYFFGNWWVCHLTC
ncbi:MAG: hypothetical protein HC880_21440 [Bacteroidia bacterium]|nr:hypothetical protein [Bacteroidia bacterium]